MYKAHFSVSHEARSVQLTDAVSEALRTQLLSDDYPGHCYRITFLKQMNYYGSPIPGRDQTGFGYRSNEDIEYADIHLGELQIYVT